MDENKVVGLKGEFVPGAGEVHKGCVELLETLLADAKAGDIHAVVAVCDYPSGVRFAVVGCAMGYDMIGGIEVAKRRLVATLE